MSKYSDNDYFDFDIFDEDKSSYRRNPSVSRQSPDNRSGRPQRRPQRRPSGNRSPYKRTSSNNRFRIRKRTRNRIVMVAAAILAFILFIIIISTIFRGCSTGVPDNVSTETVADTVPETKINSELIADNFVTPVISDNNTDGEMAGNLYVWNKSGFELFDGTDSTAQTYADTINGFADHFGDNINVYNMVVPTNTELGLPQRLLSNGVSSASQSENIKKIYSALSDKITPINCYNKLANHNKEYIFYKSDYHWTDLGAYYAYAAFAETKELDVLSLDNCTENKIDNFTGWYANIADGLDSDTVSYRTFSYNVTMEVESETGITTNYNSPYDETVGSGSGTYSVFIMGNNPRTVLRSSSKNAESNKKIAVVKDNYGSGFVPYLTYNYSEVHVIDYRSYSGDFLNYCQENNITDVLFLNGVMSANTQEQINMMNNIFK